MSTFEQDLPLLKIWVEHSDRAIDNQKLLSLKTSCENNNVKDHNGVGQYDELIKMIEKKLEV